MPCSIIALLQLLFPWMDYTGSKVTHKLPTLSNSETIKSVALDSWAWRQVYRVDLETVLSAGSSFSFSTSTFGEGCPGACFLFVGSTHVIYVLTSLKAAVMELQSLVKLLYFHGTPFGWAILMLVTAYDLTWEAMSYAGFEWLLWCIMHAVVEILNTLHVWAS